MASESDQMVVVGAGVLGLCAAYYAARAGRRVVVLEREPADGDNCSTGNAGMVVPSHFVPLAAPGMIAKGLRWMLDRESPFYVRPRPDPKLARWGWLFLRHSTARHVEASRQLLADLNLESRRLFRELAGDGEFGWRENGLLMLCDTQKGLDAEGEVAAQAGEVGVEAEVLDAASAAKLEPDIGMSLAGAVHYPQDCHMDPARFMAMMRRRLVDLGVELVFDAEVGRIERSGGRVKAVTAGGRRIEGGHFVFTGGAWTAELMRKLGVRMPLQPGKGYSLTLPSPRELPSRCAIFSEAKVAVSPVGGALRFAGTMEIGARDLSIDDARVRGIIRSVPRYYPAFREEDFEGVAPWAGLRPVSPDGVPYIGPVPRCENAYAAAGHAMMGLSLGPVTGRLLADLITGAEPFRPIGRLAVGRFG